MKLYTSPDTETLRRLAVEASVDPRTISKIIDGRPVRGMARRRALDALRRAGIDVPSVPHGQDEARHVDALGNAPRADEVAR
ncbi:MAG: hypothetical protein HYV09_29215 [Deltaproteobacteria bacterium]|nr:hypothetical protein [Deltaproteobacteria bacterium]